MLDKYECEKCTEEFCEECDPPECCDECESDFCGSCWNVVVSSDGVRCNECHDGAEEDEGE